MSDAVQDEEVRAGAEPRVALVYSLFFLSGVAALVYEASWSRLVGLAIGQTAEAAALILTAFFIGLAIGQFLGGQLASHISPLFGYGLAELIAAVWACLVPGLVDWIGTPAGPGEWELLRNSPGGRAAWCVLILLPATIPLGATLPLVVQFLTTRGGSRQHGPIAYGLNTAGGWFGIVAASAFLLIVVGVRASGYIAATISAVCGSIVCVTAAIQRRTSKPHESEVAAKPASGSWGWIILAAISGFGTLGLEVLYIRMFALVFHNSVYTFGIVVAAFLLALSLGAALASWLGRRFTASTVAIASFSLGSVALAVSVVAFPRLTGLGYFSFGESFASYLAGASGLVATYVVPPIALLGMTLPIAIQAVAGSRTVGLLAAANTLAGSAGAIAAGFLLPTRLGLWPSFAMFVALFGVAGAAMLVRSGRRRLAASLALVVAAPVAANLSGPSSDLWDTTGDVLIRRWESAYGWIDVVKTRKGDLEVRQNLHYQHGSTAKAAREYRQGRLPLLLHPRPADVAFLGLGTGLTAASVVVDKEVGKAVIVDLIPEVVQAARLLRSANLGVVDHPKVEIHVNDARHYLRRTERHFDVIVSDLFVPWESRAGYLYTVEFYQTVRHRLKPRGLFCQWLALYQFGPEQLDLVADSFSSVFPHTTLWWGQFDAKYPIVALVGSEEPLAVDFAKIKERMDALSTLPTGADPDLQVPSDLPALYLGEWRRDPSRKLNTDENPWLEFTAPVSHRARRTLNGSMLRRYFDSVFSRLPRGEIRFGREFDGFVQDDGHRFAVQRLSLFGDTDD